MKKLVLYFFILSISVSISSCFSDETDKGHTQSPDTKLRTLDDIRKKSIGVLLGSLQDEYVTENFPGAKIIRIDHSSDLAMSLQQGQCEAILLDNVTSSYLMKENSEFAFLDDSVTQNTFAIGFQSDKKELQGKFNEFLKEIRNNGVYNEIYNRWIKNSETSVMPAIENKGKNGIIHMGTTGESIPFSFVKNNIVVGFDIELMYRFAAYMNMILDIKIFNFGGMLAALISNKIDLGANSIMVTEERAKQILFSDGYFTTTSGMLALKSNLIDPGVNKVEKKSFFAKVKESFENNILREKRYYLILDGLKVTFIITVLAAVFGTILGGLICALRMSKRKSFRLTGKGYIGFFRGIPQVVFLMLMFYVIMAPFKTDGVTVAVISFAMYFSAYVSEMFRTSIESIRKGQTEASLAMGFSKFKTFIYIILPQATQRVLPVYKGEFISLVKITAIVGYIAVLDLTKASDIIRSRTFDAFFPLIMVAVLYFLLAWILTLILDIIQIKTAPKRNI
ncbi:MAG: ABC transporter substrate-binding protein/permease [Rikenellaceae bacterium]|nr:ABC transporter substrate-binding protein/permease [Rikenellaceae bacterium]